MAPSNRADLTCTRLMAIARRVKGLSGERGAESQT